MYTHYTSDCAILYNFSKPAQLKLSCTLCGLNRHSVSTHRSAALTHHPLYVNLYRLQNSLTYSMLPGSLAAREAYTIYFFAFLNPVYDDTVQLNSTSSWVEWVASLCYDARRSSPTIAVLTRCHAIAGRTARCRCKFRYAYEVYSGITQLLLR